MRHKKNFAFYASICGCRYLYFGKPKIKSIVKWIFVSFFYAKFNKQSDGSTVFFRSMSIVRRKDLDEMQNIFIEFIKPPPNIVYGHLKLNFKYPYDFIKWIYLYITFIDSFYIRPSGWRNKVIVFFSGLYFFSTLQRINIESNEVFVFCDSVGLDAAIAKFYSSQGATVTCIQHGQYRYEPSTINSDIIPFVNACGSQILIWGSATELEYQRAKIANYTTKIVGKFFRHQKTYLSNKKISHLCVVLNGPDSAYVNINLINIALEFKEKSGLSISIRKHPADKFKYNTPNFQDSDEPSTIFLCHSSGFIIDSLCMKRRIAILKNEFSPTIYSPIPCQVEKATDIIRLIDESPDYWQEIFNKYTSYFIKNA